MNRSERNLRWWLPLLLAGVACVLGGRGWSVPLVTTDSSKPSRTFRVCILLLRSQTKPGNPSVIYWNPDPWVLPVLNHSPFKPVGWTLENPLAPGVVPNDADLDRSGAAYASDKKGGQDPQNNWFRNRKNFGDPLTKDDPAYWVAKLDANSLDALADFDLLVLNGHNASTLSNEDRDNLRDLLQRGATVWINNSQRSGMQIRNFFLDPPVVFQEDKNAWYSDTSHGTSLVKADPAHWLLNSYYKLTDAEVYFLRDNLSWRSYIKEGIAGYQSNNHSQLHEVVRLQPAFQDATYTWPYAATVAAGQVGAGDVIVTGTDMIGAMSDWWERKHNRTTMGYSLDIWPYNTIMGENGNQPNCHYTYIAACKFIFNMLSGPATWQLSGGTSRSSDMSYANALTRGWTANLTTLGEPVTYGPYVAVTGNNCGGTTATELRVYRTRRVLDDDGTVQDYPFGLYRETCEPLLTRQPTVRPAAWNSTRVWRGEWQSGANYRRESATYKGDIISYNGTLFICNADHAAILGNRPGAGAAWTAVWAYLPADAMADSEMDLCFILPAAHWVGSPIFDEVTGNLDPADPTSPVVTRTVLYALQAVDIGGGVWRYRPRCFAIDPYVIGTTKNVGEAPQILGDLWANEAIAFTETDRGLPRASMTLSNGHLVITTFGKTTATTPPRMYLLDASASIEAGGSRLRASIGSNPPYDAQFRLTGPASMISAQVNYLATDIEAGNATRVAGNANNGPYLLSNRRDVVEMLVARGEYFPPGTDPAVTSGAAALFLVPATITAPLPAGQPFSSDQLLSLTLTDSRNNAFKVGVPTDAFRQKNVLTVAAEGGAIKITFRSWDVFFRKGGSGSPELTLPVALTYAPPRTAGTPAGQAPVTPITIGGLLPSMGYPVLLPGTQHFDLGGRLTLHSNVQGPTDGDGTDTFGYQVDAPVLLYRDQLVAGTNTDVTAPASVPSLQSSQAVANTAGGQMLKNLIAGGALTSIRYTQHPGFSTKSSNNNLSMVGFPMGLPWHSRTEWASQAFPATFDPWGESLAWQFRGDTWGPASAAVSRANDTYFHSDFPFPSAVGNEALYTIGLYHGYESHYTRSDYQPLAANDFGRGMLYALDPTPPRYLQQVVTAATLPTNGGVRIGYRDTTEGLTYTLTGATLPATADQYRVKITGTVSAVNLTNTIQWSKDGGATWHEPLVQNLSVTGNNLDGIITVRFPRTSGYAVGTTWVLSAEQWARQLRVRDTSVAGALRVGARMLMKYQDPANNLWTTADLGTVTALRSDPAAEWADNTPYVTGNTVAVSGAMFTCIAAHVSSAVSKPGSGATWTNSWRRGGDFWVTFDRPRPADAVILTAAQGSLLAATSVPYVSHVRRWSALSGSEPVRTYSTLGGPARTRVSEGLCAPTTGSASTNPDPTLGNQEVSIEFFNGLDATCHDATSLDGAAIGNPVAITDQGSYPPQDWELLEHLVLPPRVKAPGDTGLPGQVLLQLVNYKVDYRMGRIQLTPRIAGEFADRFVLVHYFTNDLQAGQAQPQPVHHAEVMYIPSQIKWQYSFAADNAIPDSGPVVVSDTIYMTALRYQAAAWHPVLYAFPATPVNPLQVQPLWIRSLNTSLGTGQVPYRAITSPTPTDNGILVGTALGSDELTLYCDQGTLISDGHRLLRIDASGLVTWQASATKDFDPAALAASDGATKAAGLTQQAFTLITRLHRLPTGNVLVCDTGANRVVECDRNGLVTWQYPDSDLTYQDPDLDSEGKPVQGPGGTAMRDPSALRVVTPTALRINGPRDVRRYTHDNTITHVYWGTVDLGAATIRWETTVIADAGNNRIIEVQRPLVSLQAPGVLAPGFRYRPDTYYMNGGQRVYLAQFTEVLVDATTLTWATGETVGKPMTFTIAMRYRGPDNLLTDTQPNTSDPVMDGVRTRELLAVVGNLLPDPSQPNGYLRTVLLSVPTAGGAAVVGNFSSLTADAAANQKQLSVMYAPEFRVGEVVSARNMTTGHTQNLGTITAINPATNTLTVTNALDETFPQNQTRVIRARTNALDLRPYTNDYVRIWQLDLVTLRNPNTDAREVRVLVVDRQGVREALLSAPSQPIFEMTQMEYANAVAAFNGASAAATAWSKDTLFAPVSVLRIDPGGGESTADPRQARYFIGQMNPTPSTSPDALIDGKLQRRVHCFEARWTDQTQSYDPLNPTFGWGIVDTKGYYFVYPDPLSTEFPNLPGGSYPITQPLSIDRD